jgi:hypothetical protein
MNNGFNQPATFGSTGGFTAPASTGFGGGSGFGTAAVITGYGGKKAPPQPDFPEI